MRMFAGPNGSGKSQLKKYLPAPLLGVYLNPDSIEDTLRRDGDLDLEQFGVESTRGEIVSFFSNSAMTKARSNIERCVRLTDSRLSFADTEIDSYIASALVDFLRRKLIDRKRTFTFETVMSHPSKIELFHTARRSGYRTYLYYIATDDPTINIGRVRNRVSLGGHPVPEDRIIDRYYRSLGLLAEAIKLSNRAYIFDNSVADAEHTWIAEITDGRTLEVKTASLPEWFQTYVLDKFSAQ